MILDRLEAVRKGGRVKRFHTVPTIGTQTVSAHTWGVMDIIVALWPDSRAELLKAALWHDAPEINTGDIPAPVKWASEDLVQVIDKLEEDFVTSWGLQVHEMTEEELTRLKAADMLEGMLFCVEQHEMGNKSLERTFRRWYDRLKVWHDPTVSNLALAIKLRYYNV